VTRRASGVVVSCVLAAGALAGCTSVRSDLGTSDSSCYIALPVAARAVGPHGRLIGVHLVTLGALRRRAPEIFDALTGQPAADQRVCLVAFAGSFTSGSVSKPLGLPSGTTAVVVSKIPSNALIGTVIIHGASLRFGHPHIG